MTRFVLRQTNPISSAQSVVFKCSFYCGVRIEVALRALEMFVLYYRLMLEFRLPGWGVTDASARFPKDRILTFLPSEKRLIKQETLLKGLLSKIAALGMFSPKNSIVIGISDMFIRLW